LNFASLVVDDPIGHRLDIWGAGNYASHIYFVTVQVLDNLEGDGMRASENQVALGWN
jgi:hypothetical protein